MLNKRGQVTIFIILAIVIIVGGISYFTFRNMVTSDSVPTSLSPVKVAIVDCIEEKSEIGLSIMKSSGGYIELPEFKPGSRYQPSSSQLFFVGTNIPYWFYMSASNLPKTQVPTIESMEKSLESFLNHEVQSCYLDGLREEGYDIELGSAKSSVIISDGYVDFEVDMDVTVSKGLDSGTIKKYEVRVDTNLGYLYEEAKSIYDEEQETFFLENYTIDVLRLYAPVDGVELTCSPKTWESSEIYTDIKYALQENTMQLRNTEAREDYFNLELESKSEVKFLYFSDWTTYFEVNPTNNNVLVAKPVGDGQGMGMLGFCYVPYHFVYNFRHPVLIQVSKDDETFQFPMMVLIEGNLPRKAMASEIISISQKEICENKNSNLALNIYDENMNPIDADISFECISVSCDIEYSMDESESVKLPQCANGVLRIDAEGYKSYKMIHSSIQDGSIAVILDKEYEKDISLFAAGKKYSDKAIITFISEEESRTVIYPEDKKVSLSAGDYEIQIYLYKNSELKLPATTKENCYDVPKSGLLGMAGMTKQECVTVDVPEQILTEALIGGGSSEYYFSNSELSTSEGLKLSLDNLMIPKTFDELQTNYLLFDVTEVEVELE